MATKHLCNPDRRGNQDLHTLAGLCKRVRYRKSDCQRCVDICPENAISLDPGPTVSDSCSACGLCVTTCPTEVFRDDLYLEGHLLEQAKSRLAAGQEKSLSIHCHRAEDRDGNSLPLPCLGRISDYFIVGAALAGFDEVLFTIGACSQCRFKHGDEVLGNSIRAARPLLEGLGLGDFGIRVEEKEKRAVLVRRDIFSKIFQNAKLIQERVSDRPERRGSRGHSPRRNLLRKLLSRRNWENSPGVRYQPELPWGEIWIDADKCSACGICANVCPVGAIQEQTDADHQLLFFNSASCHNCRLCQGACPENAIDFEEDLAVTAVTDNRPKVVAEIALSSCVACGQSIPARGNALCPTCRKRQLPPMGWLTPGKETCDGG